MLTAMVWLGAYIVWSGLAIAGELSEMVRYPGQKADGTFWHTFQAALFSLATLRLNGVG